MKTFRVLGIMSGTSLDGVDLALCTFKKTGNQWKFTVEAAETVPYDEQWKMFLSNLHSRRAEEFAFVHSRYGHYLGKLADDFLKKQKKNKKADFISSHGHTVFHQPGRGFTFQIGDGAAISAVSGLPVVCDFRTMDVALGGQGAPLVPIGDTLLFGQYTWCLNLGGIANISSRHGSKKLSELVAFDVCPCNMVLNMLAGHRGKDFDEKGKLAATGKINKDLLQQLKDLPYYKKSKRSAKSLGREDVEKDFISIVNAAPLSVEDKLCTFCEHIALMISKELGAGSKGSKSKGSLLITGGGAYNDYLVERIRHHSKVKVVIPDKMIIEFKEAIIFGFLGVLRWAGEINCLKSVTGAERDSVGGAVYFSS